MCATTSVETKSLIFFSVRTFFFLAPVTSTKTAALGIIASNSSGLSDHGVSGESFIMASLGKSECSRRELGEKWVLTGLKEK
jgi:hypothetical protein